MPSPTPDGESRLYNCSGPGIQWLSPNPIRVLNTHMCSRPPFLPLPSLPLISFSLIPCFLQPGSILIWRAKSKLAITQAQFCCKHPSCCYPGICYMMIAPCQSNSRQRQRSSSLFQLHPPSLSQAKCKCKDCSPAVGKVVTRGIILPAEKGSLTMCSPELAQMRPAVRARTHTGQTHGNQWWHGRLGFGSLHAEEERRREWDQGKKRTEHYKIIFRVILLQC